MYKRVYLYIVRILINLVNKLINEAVIRLKIKFLGIIYMTSSNI